MKIYYSVNCTSSKEIERSIKERLFSLPWRPFQKTRTIQEPAIYLVKGDIIAHPEFKEQLDKANQAMDIGYKAMDIFDRSADLIDRFKFHNWYLLGESYLKRKPFIDNTAV